MRKILGYIFTPLGLVLFGLWLLIFHVIQVACRLFSEKLRLRSVNLLTFFLTYTGLIVGARIRFRGFSNVPNGRPIIIVSNHQSALDIPPIVWGFRKFLPRFVAKQSLGKGIPSISYNLSVGGSALIDRKNPRQSISEISRLGKLLEREKCAVSIFPEGTRSKDGKMRRFQHSGIITLLKYAPSAIIVPMVVDGHSELTTHGVYPLLFGTKLTYTALAAIDPKEKGAEEASKEAENAIRKALGYDAVD